MADTWRDVARELGERMEHHAFCDDHEPSEAVPDSCPFCADRAAYRRYLRKAGLREVQQEGESVGVWELFARQQEQT